MGQTHSSNVDEKTNDEQRVENELAYNEQMKYLETTKEELYNLLKSSSTLQKPDSVITQQPKIEKSPNPEKGLMDISTRLGNYLENLGKSNVKLDDSQKKALKDSATVLSPSRSELLMFSQNYDKQISGSSKYVVMKEQWNTSMTNLFNSGIFPVEDPEAWIEALTLHTSMQDVIDVLRLFMNLLDLAQQVFQALVALLPLLLTILKYVCIFLNAFFHLILIILYTIFVPVLWVGSFFMTYDPFAGYEVLRQNSIRINGIIDSMF